MGSVIREVAGRAGVRVIDAGRQELIAAADAPAFVDSCVAEGCRILGVEGFHVVNGGVEPQMDAIADFSTLSDLTDSAREAREFLASLGDAGLAFAFTLGEEPALES
jgi:hypothetical protein